MKRDGSMTPAQLDHAALIATSRDVDMETAQELVYLRARLQEYEGLRLAIGSLLDVVLELVIAMEQGNKPDQPWTDTVVEVIKGHKRELRFYE